MKLQKFDELSLYTVGTFHTKGWSKIFSGQISSFWGQNNVSIIL
jgi:hypothetical protein